MEQLDEQLSLKPEQLDAVIDAYATRRSTISDGFYLQQRGYLERDAMRENFETSAQTLRSTLRNVLTPEQYDTYEASGLAEDNPFGFSRRRRR